MSLLQNSNAISEGGYPISNSLRFQSASSQSLSRTFLTPTDAKKWTFSGWIKRANLSTDQVFFGSAVSTAGYNESRLYFLANNTIRLLFQNGSSTAAELITTQVFRDPSAFYHISVVVDTNNATSSDRVILYINGVRVTAFSTATYPSLSASFNFNTAVQHALGAGYTTATQTSPNFGFTDGYMTEVNFVDGQALTPAAFGETDVLTGQWVAKKYTGTYGTNGFYLPFSNGTSTTTLGYDSSGNSNNWTLNNFTRSAGVTDCWMYDVPSGNGSVVGGTQPNSNYPTMNPLNNNVLSAWSIASFRRGNLEVGDAAANQNKVAVATMSMSSGKYYWEVTVGTGTPTTNTFFGIVADTQMAISKVTGVYYMNNGQKMISGTNSAYAASYTAGDVIGFAYDGSTGSLTCYKNNTSQGVINSTLSGTNWIPAMVCDNAGSGVTYYNAFNFGNRSFVYTPPSGYVALCTANLPAATIKKGNQYMDATTYSGNGSSGKVVTNAAGFSPDFVWLKDRSAANYHGLFDAIRGAGYALYSNGTFAESAFNAQTLQSFNSNGFTVGSNGDFNTNANSLVAWQWDAGSSTVTNTNGSISSQVRANPTAGVSVVTWTGSGAVGTVGHGLGVAPKMIIAKSRSTANAWGVFHQSANSGVGQNGYLLLNSTAAYAGDINAWNNTAPTANVFSVANGGFNTGTMVAYVFSEISGFSKFGSYTGNGSTDGTFVYLGFRPKFILIKASSQSGNDWQITDTSRSTYNAAAAYLYPDLANAEGGSSFPLDILSNGFKLRNTTGDNNNSGVTFIYAAFAESPFASSNAR